MFQGRQWLEWSILWRCMTFCVLYETLSCSLCFFPLPFVWLVYSVISRFNVFLELFFCRYYKCDSTVFEYDAKSPCCTPEAPKLATQILGSVLLCRTVCGGSFSSDILLIRPWGFVFAVVKEKSFTGFRNDSAFRISSVWNPLSFSPMVKLVWYECFLLVMNALIASASETAANRLPAMSWLFCVCVTT